MDRLHITEREVMNTRRVCCLVSCLLAGAMIAWAPGITYAGFLTAYSGNTRAVAQDSVVDGSISFGVWDNGSTGGDKISVAVPGDTFVSGVGSTADIDDARYVYLYQIVNDGTNGIMINDFTVHLGVDASKISAWGYFDDVSLSDTDGVVGVNAPFGNGAPAFGVAGSVAPENIDWASSTGGFVADTSVLAPTVGVGIVTGGDTDTFRSYFSFSGANPIADQAKSVILAFSSDYAPSFNLVTFKDSVEYLAQGTVASPTPEPSTVVGLLSLLPLGLIALRRRRRGNSTS